MRILRHSLRIETHSPIEIVDLTDEARAWVRASGARDGLLTVTSPHTTARITVNEREPRLQQDMVRFLERLAPRNASYGHDEGSADGRENAHAHLLGLLISATESIPVVTGDLSLGTWQSLFLVELDGPRAERHVDLQLLVAG